MSLGAGRTVVNVVKLTKRAIKPGFNAWRLNAEQLQRLDPFLACDWFEMSQPTFPPHPHAGFSAVTLLFENSEGSFVNRDSQGEQGDVEPGDTQWTCAGSGMMHEEIPKVPGVVGKGLQIFVNLSSKHKAAQPQVDMLRAKDTPVYMSPSGARVRVIAGETADGVASPLNASLLNKVTLLDLSIPSGASFTHPIPAGHNAVALVVSGSVAIGAGASATVVSEESVCELSDDGSVIQFTGAGPDIAQVVLFSGVPLGEPVVWKGPFCGASTAQVDAYAAAYSLGLMGSLAPSPIFSQMGR